MKTALVTESVFYVSDAFKSWLKQEYTNLSCRYNMLGKNPLRHGVHEARLELIEVGRAVGLDLVVNKGLEEE